jgi:MFS family permease
MLGKKTKILLFSDYLLVFGSGLLGPLFSIFTERIGGDILDISWIWGIYLILTGLLIILIGKISDKFIKKEKLVVLGFSLSAVFTFGYLLVSTPMHLLLVQIGLSFGTALLYPTWDALFARYEDHKNAGYDWGLVDGGEQILPGIAIFTGGLIVYFFSFKVLFICMGSIQLLGAIYQTKILRNIRNN